MNTKTFGEGTMLMLGDVIARIGCAAAMPNEHKSDWLANRFSLKPAMRIRLPGQTGTHLLWLAADVEKARKMWEAANPPFNDKRQVVSHTVQPVVGPELTGITLTLKSGRVELTVEEAKSLYSALDSIFGPKYFPPIQPSEPSYPQYPQVTWTTRYDTTTVACHE